MKSCEGRFKRNSVNSEAAVLFCVQEQLWCSSQGAEELDC